MVFDGRQSGHPDTRLISPYVYHPRAPLTGYGLGQVLETAYFIAHNSGSPVLDQYYPVTWRSQDFRARMIITASSFVRVAEGFRYIPNAATHLVGEAVFTILDAVQEASAYHRVSTSVGGVVNGNTVETQISNPTNGVNGRGGIDLSGIDLGYYLAKNQFSPFGPKPQTYTAQFEMPLTSGQAGRYDCEIFVEAYSRDRATANNLSYFPQQYTVWWEAR